MTEWGGDKSEVTKDFSITTQRDQNVSVWVHACASDECGVSNSEGCYFILNVVLVFVPVSDVLLRCVKHIGTCLGLFALWLSAITSST